MRETMRKSMRVRMRVLERVRLAESEEEGEGGIKIRARVT